MRPGCGNPFDVVYLPTATRGLTPNYVHSRYTCRTVDALYSHNVSRQTDQAKQTTARGRKDTVRS